jgi:anti-anti-sigma factor
VRIDGHDAVFLLAGEIDLAGRSVLTACLDSIGTSYGRVFVDMADVTFIDSAGIQILAQSALDLQKERACELLITNAHPHVRRVLEVAGMEQFLKVE